MGYVFTWHGPGVASCYKVFVDVSFRVKVFGGHARQFIFRLIKRGYILLLYFFTLRSLIIKVTHNDILSRTLLIYVGVSILKFYVIYQYVAQFV